MKIMFLSATYFPLQDGVSMVTQYMAEGLSKRHEILIVTSLQDGLERNESHNNVRIERIKAERNRYTLRMVGEKALVKNKIKAFNPDVLVAVSITTWTYDWLVGELDKLPCKKVLYNHGFSLREDYDVIKLIKNFRIRRQILSDLLQIYSEWFWDRYSKSLVKQTAKYDKVIYLHNKDKLYEMMKSNGINNDVLLGNAVEDVFFERNNFISNNHSAITFINVSSYNENKNQEMALRAFYKAGIRDSRLLLIGSQQTSYYKYLLDLNEKLRVEYDDVGNNVEIYCGISRGRVVELYREADAYLLTSKVESWSLTLCEAAALGLVLLSTDVGQGNCIPGVFICRTEDEFTENMRIISEDAELMAERGRMAYEYAQEHFRIADKVSQFEKLLLDLTGNECDAD